jgi:hypothetical protein
MSSTPQPTWRPISWLPTISSAISGGLATAQEFHGTLEQGWEQPYRRMDEATLARVRRVYVEQADDVELYAEQLRRWQAGSMSLAQRQEVDRLAGQVEQWRSAVAAVLELADELKDNTIEALLRKSDLEVGVEALLGQEPHRRGGGRAERTPGLGWASAAIVRRQRGRR